MTVAVLTDKDINSISSDAINDNDLRIEWFSGTGKGGQHRNKKQNSCRVIHLPTGIVETRQGRKRESNLREAKQSIEQRIRNHYQQSTSREISIARKNQVGSGMRGDKIRTYRLQDDRVVDHVSGQQAKASKVLRGYIDLLWL